MKIKSYSKGDIALLELSEELYGGPSDMQLVDVIDKYINEGYNAFILDIGKIEWISSVGTGILVTAYSRAKRKNSVIAIVNANRRIQEVIKRSGLDRIFNLYENVEDAKKFLRNNR